MHHPSSLAWVQRAGGNILGVIVNHLDFTHAQRYYGEYGAAGYEYGGYGGYGNYGGTPKIGKTAKAKATAGIAQDRAA